MQNNSLCNSFFFMLGRQNEAGSNVKKYKIIFVMFHKYYMYEATVKY